MFKNGEIQKKQDNILKIISPDDTTKIKTKYKCKKRKKMYSCGIPSKN